MQGNPTQMGAPASSRLKGAAGGDHHGLMRRALEMARHMNLLLVHVQDHAGFTRSQKVITPVCSSVIAQGRKTCTLSIMADKPWPDHQQPMPWPKRS